MTAEYIGVEDIRRRSIAELNLIEMLMAESRQTAETFSYVINMIENYLDRRFEIVKALYEKTRFSKNQTEELKDKALEYLISVGAGLVSKDMYWSVIVGLDKISQNLDGVAYRLFVLATKKMDVGVDLSKDIKTFAETVKKEYDQLASAIRMLGINPRNSVEEARSIVKTEEDIDTAYRDLEFKLFEKYSSDIPRLMVLKEIVDLLEETADLIRSTAEYVKFIALHKV